MAKFDYEKERDDILSFKEGERFRIASKAGKKWWAAYSVSTGEYGYVPSAYMELYVDPEEGERILELSESDAGDHKRLTLDELKRTIPKKPPAAPGGSVEEDSDEGHSASVSPSHGGGEDPVIIKPIDKLVQLPEDFVEVEGKKLPNPCMESKVHRQLRKEIKFNNARGHKLGKSELEKVMQRRKPDAEGRTGPIRADRVTTSKQNLSTADNELAQQLARRSHFIEEAERDEHKEKNDEKLKPEFLKVSLRKTPAHS